MTQSRERELAMRMAELARSVAVPRSPDDVLSDVTAAAIELIPGVDSAGVLLVKKGGRFETLGGTSEMPRKLDELQMKHNEGPCVDAARDELIVRTDDFRAEPRWPHYSREVVKLGVLSGLSVKLYTADRTAGALDLFSVQAHAFDTDAETVATVLGAHAASAILASRQSDELQSALSTRDRIGQAKGIVMERYRIDDVQAFDLLRRLSQEGNIKLADVAQQVIDTRD